MKTLVKAKIVLENKEKRLAIYTWRKTFLWFGKWEMHGMMNYSSRVNDSKIENITDNAVSMNLYNSFIVGNSAHKFI